jgi:hypothetical protein
VNAYDDVPHAALRLVLVWLHSFPKDDGLRALAGHVHDQITDLLDRVDDVIDERKCEDP